MSSKFSRFLHLERSREERARTEEPSRLQNGNRFEAVEGPGAGPQEAAVPEAHLERFKRQGETPLALEDERRVGAEHFPRCVQCHSENGRFLEKCLVCGADLNTPEQREYNERLRQARQQEALQEREALEDLARHRTEEQRREAEERYAVLLARLREQEGSGEFWRALERHGSLGLGLLRRIRHPLVRALVIVACISVPLLLMRYGRGLAWALGLFLGFILLMVFLPTWLRGSKRWR